MDKLKMILKDNTFIRHTFFIVFNAILLYKMCIRDSPGSLPPSIISAKELNFCVRYGNRCDLLAIATAYLLSLLYCTLKTE